MTLLIPLFIGTTELLLIGGLAPFAIRWQEVAGNDARIRKRCR